LIISIDKSRSVQDLTDVYDLAAKNNLSMVMAAEKKNNMEGYVIIALKSIAVYVFIVAAIRLLGRRSLLNYLSSI